MFDADKLHSEGFLSYMFPKLILLICLLDVVCEPLKGLFDQNGFQDILHRLPHLCREKCGMYSEKRAM